MYTAELPRRRTALRTLAQSIVPNTAHMCDVYAALQVRANNIYSTRVYVICIQKHRIISKYTYTYFKCLIRVREAQQNEASGLLWPCLWAAAHVYTKRYTHNHTATPTHSQKRIQIHRATELARCTMYRVNARTNNTNDTPASYHNKFVIYLDLSVGLWRTVTIIFCRRLCINLCIWIIIIAYTPMLPLDFGRISLCEGLCNVHSTNWLQFD